METGHKKKEELGYRARVWNKEGAKGEQGTGRGYWMNASIKALCVLQEEEIGRGRVLFVDALMSHKTARQKHKRYTPNTTRAQR